MNPEKLSLLSDQELLLLAERMGFYIPEGLDRPFIIEEIVSALEDEDRERVFSHDGTGHVEEKKLSGGAFTPYAAPIAACVPDRYNETMIRALPRDPSWIYAYWDIADQRRTSLGEEEGSSGLFLRVVEMGSTGEGRKSYFDIQVTLEDWKWYINIPRPGHSYRVDLCFRTVNKIRVLARSNEVRMPVHHLEGLSRLPQMTKSLLILSDLEGLHLTEPGTDNPSRILVAEEE
ncbi:MAG: DUF4912 domain-containing protein [Spirochaetia bacterium]|uniref:DUF4912 domain-containing protein n=2 Tax=root TaxID=1 RepID=A0A652ZXD2_9SPIR|nr:DUF4912 domain-containing protein [Spirochaetia bacterium]MDD3982107.1 DUF4912 domain-containing protein [Spirochaetales bacterium]NLX46529.1 DUF4912 domain-containing protein [Treponema sp.]VBB40446.1 conserved hypothetical protein [uncultured Spirochaetota bacterium]MCE1207932.1 DUF4912 domain-containing protein [Spirochaetia bacterium]